MDVLTTNETSSINCKKANKLSTTGKILVGLTGMCFYNFIIVY